jgi:hypothetical protein
MSFFSVILAQGETGAEEAGALQSRLITLGAYTLVIVVVLIWALFIRKQRSNRRRAHRHKTPNWKLSEEDKTHGPRRHRHRGSKIKSPQLPRNPSLAEGAGLPPRRPDDVLPPGP